MTMQDRINNLQPYFKEMQVNAANGIIYITIQFPKGWACSEVTEHNFNVKTVHDNETGLFYFFAEMSCGFDKIFDAIEYNIKFNEEAQAKVNLLRGKIEELRTIFETEDIEVLKTLEFKYKKKKVKEVKPKKEKQKQENELENQITDESTLECVNTNELTNALNTLQQQFPVHLNNDNIEENIND